MVGSAELELTNSIVGVMRTTGPEGIVDGKSRFFATFTVEAVEK